MKLPTLLSITLVGCMATTSAPTPEDTDPDPAPASDPIEKQTANQDVSPFDIGSCFGRVASLDHSFVIQDPTVLAKFSLQRTLQQILDSEHDHTQTATQLFQRWMASYGDCSNTRIDPYHYGITCPRPESALASIDPFDPASGVVFAPIAVVNRFDLAPTNGMNCGEYRIAYAMKSNTVVTGRALLNFEGVLRNPRPDLGIEGCRRVAQWWSDRSKDTTADQLAANLESFFYTGTALIGFGPVVSAQSYGFGQGHRGYNVGQIRANMFVTNHEWNLREFKTNYDQNPYGAIIAIDQVTVKNNPADELFRGSADQSPYMRTVMQEQLPALAAATTATVSDSIPDFLNEYESVSTRTNVLYDQFSNADMRTAIQTELTTEGITNLSVDNILRRASSQTCAGCHQASTFSPENDLGDNQFVGGTLPFVHVESGVGSMSPALRYGFVPHRQQVLAGFLCSTNVADDGLNVGGGVRGAAN
ncbi:MAG: hypothetical protein QM831_27235 [Kofleriaceae bacterium]